MMVACQPSPSTTSPSCRASRRRIPCTRRERPVRGVTTRAARLRGRGVPGAARLRGRRSRRPGPVHPPGPDGRGRVRARRAEGHALASASRLRDRHLHDRRHVRAQRLERGRGSDHQRRHAVDDRRRRHPAHREAARGTRRQRRPVPRLPAVGQPAGRPEVVAAALPGHPRRRGRARWRRPTGERSCASSPARWPGTPARARPTRR